MSLPDEFDPDDNFDHAFAPLADIDEDAAPEALAWQLLLLLNPDDEDAALQQFMAWQDALLAAGDPGDPIALLRDAIDWKAGFYCADDDPRALVDCLDQLAARWNLRIDWGLDEDDDALDDADVATLVNIAHDRLREHHLTVWTWETGSEHHGGWITREQDDEALRLVAGALGLHVRTGAG